jgi:hypothetical protein
MRDYAGRTPPFIGFNSPFARSGVAPASRGSVSASRRNLPRRLTDFHCVTHGTDSLIHNFKLIALTHSIIHQLMFLSHPV